MIVTANGQTFGEIDEILDFGAYYRIIRAGRKDLSFHRSEVQFQRNCLADGKNKEAFQYFKETAAAISLVTDNGILRRIDLFFQGENLHISVLKAIYSAG